VRLVFKEQHQLRIHAGSAGDYPAADPDARPWPGGR
jgi:hypothetical protein